MDKKKKIIIIVVLLLLIVVVAVGLAVGLMHVRPTSIMLEVWPQDEKGSSLITFRNDASFVGPNEQNKEFIEKYEKRLAPIKKSSVERVNCRYNTQLQENQVCEVPVDEFFPCSLSRTYGQATCVFLKLNKVRNWKPIPINSTATMPKNMPEGLKEHIRVVQGAPEANNVWVSCEGVLPVDKENIGPIQYIPRRGFPVYYFPFTNQEGYLSPLVAVYFERPMKGLLVEVVCTAWAKNIRNDEDEQQGTVQFSLLVD